jgi:peptidyl-prolyl cis-trans isomerase C
MKPTQIFVISALGMLLAVGCTKAETPEAAAAKPVAVVNGTAISRDVWNLYVKTRHAGKTPGDLTAEEQNESLDELIGMYAGSLEADKHKLGEGEPKARLELVGKSAMAELLFKKYTEGAEPTEEELKAEYEARIAEAPKQEYHARHILVDDEAKAKELITKLDAGASFEELAKDNSKDGSSTVGWASQQESLIAIRPRQAEDRRITLTAAQQSNILLLSLFIIPGVVFGTGVYSWWRRR